MGTRLFCKDFFQTFFYPTDNGADNSFFPFSACRFPDDQFAKFAEQYHKFLNLDKDQPKSIYLERAYQLYEDYRKFE